MRVKRSTETMNGNSNSLQCMHRISDTETQNNEVQLNITEMFMNALKIFCLKSKKKGH